MKNNGYCVLGNQRPGTDEFGMDVVAEILQGRCSREIISKMCMLKKSGKSDGKKRQ